MSRSVLLIASFLTLLPAFAQAANDLPVDTRTDSALTKQADDGRGTARPSPAGAIERTYDKAMDWSSGAAGAPAQGRVFDRKDPVEAVSSAAERHGESLLNWSAEKAGDKNIENKPQNDLPRRTMATQAEVAKAKTKKKSSRKAAQRQIKNDVAETKALNMAQEQNIPVPQTLPLPQNNPIIFRNVTADDNVNPPVAQSNQYDPNNKPVILMGDETPAMAAPAPLANAPLKAPAQAPVMVEPQPHTLSLPAPVSMAPVPSVDVVMPRTNNVPMIEEAPPAPAQAEAAPLATAPAGKDKPKGFTTPRIGSVPRIVTPASPIGIY